MSITLQRILEEHFRDLSVGDRFWYVGEASNETAITACQLEEMRKLYAARVICSDSDNIAAIARDPMRLRKRSLSVMVSCDELPVINLEVWKYSFKCKQE